MKAGTTISGNRSGGNSGVSSSGMGRQAQMNAGSFKSENEGSISIIGITSNEDDAGKKYS